MRRRKQPVLVTVALCLGGALTACGGGGDGEGFAAVGAGPSPGGAVGPSGAVTLVPLDSPTASGTASSTSSPPPAPGSEPPPGASPSPAPGTGSPTARPGAGPGGGATARPGGSGGGTEPGAPPGGPSGGGSPSGGPSPGVTTPPPRTPVPTSAPSTSSPRPTTSTPPPGPAVLTVSAPVTADADARWCERVTVTFRNTGGSPAASGTATFETHVIGALGIDWGTVTTSQPLPAPIAAGAARTRTYEVCVESWRVPLGMRVDTRAVTATWR
ncbi:hypothetical protein ACFFTQ_17080 [Streptomyces roseofulvus]|uniref:hypothetical protein n=1 Tax=Streptomyces roseofulvus TaxID=33902 RepID=UPI0031FBADF0